MLDLILWITSGVLLGLSSIPVARLPKPRLFWGAAWLDPTSIPWMVGFLLYGPEVALISSVVGTIGIWKLSQELAPALSAGMKLLGASCVWVTVALIAVYYWGGRYPLYQIDSVQFASALALLGGLVRTAIIAPIDYLWSIPHHHFLAERRTYSRTEILAEFGGAPRYVIVMTLYNLWQSLFDFVVPWLVLFPTGLAKAFTS